MNDEFQAPLGVTETYEPQAMMESSGQRLSRSSKAFVAIVAVYVVLSGYLLFSMNRRISELQQDWAASKAATAQLRNDIGSTRSETQTLASRLGLTQKQLESRAAALRSVAESNSVSMKLFNESFVLMQYFGYLQRNPYDPPEATLDYQGFNFWLNKLNQFNGNYVAAEMVKAFISSDEYRHRFGP